MVDKSKSAVKQFVERWRKADGAERANYQLFVQELCSLLELPTPDPAREDTRDNAYVFGRRVTFRHGDGTESSGFIDCYRRGMFVLEAKRVRKADGRSFDDAMLRARGQAEQYARALQRVRVPTKFFRSAGFSAPNVSETCLGEMFTRLDRVTGGALLKNFGAACRITRSEAGISEKQKRDSSQVVCHRPICDIHKASPTK